TIRASGNDTQDTHQYSGIVQSSVDGANTATVTQTIVGTALSPGAGSSGTQQQDGHQASSITQNASGAGNNVASVSQSLSLNAQTAGLKTIDQRQNTDSSGPNTNSGIDQTSGTGKNTATLTQTNALSALAAGANAGSQQQGSTVGGLNGVFNQSSTG